ncbi:hypothetical protein QJQ45_009409 [Haematococcus lacustris]|nr:hypothetical protein QJQ45_009409 [Haematococcus lacustris]
MAPGGHGWEAVPVCRRYLERMQFPLDLGKWKDLESLPPVGKEYQQRYKLVDDRLPKGRQRLHRVAEYQRGIDSRLTHRPCIQQ